MRIVKTLRLLLVSLTTFTQNCRLSRTHKLCSSARNLEFGIRSDQSIHQAPPLSHCLPHPLTIQMKSHWTVMMNLMEQAPPPAPDSHPHDPRANLATHGWTIAVERDRKRPQSIPLAWLHSILVWNQDRSPILRRSHYLNLMGVIVTRLGMASGHLRTENLCYFLCPHLIQMRL